MSKQALITGINGFTGRYMARELDSAGYAVSGTVQFPIDEALPGVEAIHVCNLDDREKIDAIVAETKPHVVIHLAAVSTVTCDDVDLIYRTNLLGTRHLLDALWRSGCGQDGILLASSANIYGNTAVGIMSEDTPPSPANDYAVSKLAMEHMAVLFAERLPITIARPFNYTGIGQGIGFLIPKLIDHARTRKPTIELGNLDVARDFSDVRSVVAYYRRLLECPDARGRVFNVCSGQAHSLRQLIGMVEQMSGCRFKITVNPSLVRANEVPMLWGSRDRLISTVGTVPEIPLSETLRWMFEGAL